ncbi:hypothetical protein BJY04DRAFT_198996 [Aspergillus karnatakaensis]|uniref:uncharacterized protein n=1 Tax=Aspergillus karnatakaensis TaxID=1810916 RepID=UPI003CCD1372
MVALDAVKQSNANLKAYGPGLVGVFVGGTSGIGESTARSFVRHATSPRVYLIGRSQERASVIIEELKKLNSESKIEFVKADVSLLKKVDEACEVIKSREGKVNVLVLSSGIFTTKGRDETGEGLDKKLSLHYYSRLRFITNLLPQLNAAASSDGETKGLASVVSVLEAGGEAAISTTDLELKNTYSLRNAAKHAITMTSLSFEELAKSNPAVSFIHSYPGVVKTGVARDMGVLGKTAINALYLLMKPLTVPVEESGERHLFAASGLPKNAAGEGKPYLVSWNGEPRGNEKVLGELKEKGAGEVVWKHTLDVFKRIVG